VKYAETGVRSLQDTHQQRCRISCHAAAPTSSLHQLEALSQARCASQSPSCSNTQTLDMLFTCCVMCMISRTLVAVTIVLASSLPACTLVLASSLPACTLVLAPTLPACTHQPHSHVASCITDLWYRLQWQDSEHISICLTLRTTASKQDIWHRGSSMFRMSDNMETSMSPMNCSERVDGGIVPAIVVCRCTEDALLRNVCPEVLVVHCQRCLPCAIEPVADKPSISLQVRTAVLTSHWHDCNAAM